MIVVFASGGQSQLDMWDPKPLSPLEVRGDFSAISTAVPGTSICEHMPRIAKMTDRFAIVRSMSHVDADHGSSFYLSMTGQYHKRRSSNPLPSPVDRPSHSSILRRVRPKSKFIEPAIHINGPAYVPLVIGAGQFGGFLGRDYDPMLIGDVTAAESPVPDLRSPISKSRLSLRRQLLDSIDRNGFDPGPNRILDRIDADYAQAFELMSHPATRDAFDLSKEPMSLRHRYGLNRSGQSCLLARRLVEAGVPLITVIWNHNNRGQDDEPGNADAYGWDTHNDIFEALSDVLLPRFDLSFSALLEDLQQRGLLDETLVVCMGEFGRAPLVALEKNFDGESPGRKHWPHVYSIVLAGAGVRGGHVVGASDKVGAYPASKQFGPWDVQATIFSALGIDPGGHYHDLTDRPYKISDGKVIDELYA